ncbi:cell wall-associated NlpC family hydrolase [Virgibacillus halotolerans]|uniref:C40 family peptidase n=1 Tax=Virgibacillus halotolerans TaxID=1071053 RepID=UPI00195F392C|nr:C40 family peptidase [Virgibacillus halotolerans]MBM7601591.1 cell wall-associated NlpC family hydrolase [Virgibacillus halotolerans]
MFKINHSVKKYIVSTTFVTAIALTPILSGSVFAHGGPDSEASQNNSNNAPVTQQVEKEETPTVNSGTILTGDRGETVKNVQTTLNNKGYTANPDGIFGQETDKAVRDFQKDSSLSVDGKVGPATKEALAIKTSTTEKEDLTIVDAPKQQTKASTTSASNVSNSDIVSTAQSLVGTPYTFGGTTTAGFDSSGFINYVFAQEGISLNRTHADMWASNGTFVDNPSVGDVVFFENTYKSGVSHSGIYIGNNQMIHAGTEKTGVEVTNMGYDYWQDHYIGAKSFK